MRALPSAARMYFKTISLIFFSTDILVSCNQNKCNDTDGYASKEDEDAINKADFVVLIRTVDFKVFCVVLMFHSSLDLIIASANSYACFATRSGVLTGKLVGNTVPDFTKDAAK
jgi:hypothetical protein